eukprot:gene22790-biopygen31439
MESMMALLDSGAEVDAQDYDGSTPLYDAAQQGHVECIKALLLAESRAKNDEYEVYRACMAGKEEVIASQDLATLERLLATLYLECLRKAVLEKRVQREVDKARNIATECGICLYAPKGTCLHPCGHMRTENVKLRTQLAESRAKNDEYEVYRACMAGKEEVIASQDLATLERLLATLDLECLRKTVLEKRVQREVDKARNIATECGICLYAPKGTCLHPCGHMVCRSCSDLIQLCPICRQTIAERRRVYL